MKLRLFGLASAIGLASVAPALVIDSFTDGDVNLVVSGGAGLASLDPATTLGGSRATWIGQNSFTGTRSSTLNVSGGAFSVDNSIGTDSISSIGYGVTAVNNSGAFFFSSAANLDLSGFNIYRFHFEGNDQPLMINLRLLMDGGNAGLTYSKVVAGGQLTPFIVDIGAADLASSFGSINLADVDHVRIDFFASNAGDFALTQIEAVPEPATMAILGLGVAALARRRRK